MIAENLQIFVEKLADAAKSAGRDPEDITLVAVSKTVETERIMQAYEAGHRHFGENYAQELKNKAEHIQKPINWHFIGQLQSNKVKYIADKVHLIQSVDRLSLAKELDKHAGRLGRGINILLQLSPEKAEGRGGVGMEGAKELLTQCGELTNIQIKGIMSVAPLGLGDDACLKYFEGIRNIYDKLSELCPDNASMDILSMGMTADYIQAVMQGSNMVRIGTAIFGGRQPIGG